MNNAVHAVVGTIDELPLLENIVKRLVPLDGPARQWVFLACGDEHDSAVTAALGDLPFFHPFDARDQPDDVGLKGDALEELRALARLFGFALESKPGELFLATSGYLTVSSRVIATADQARVRKQLKAAGLTTRDAASLQERSRIDEKTALARAMPPFEEHYPKVAKAMRAYLGGPIGPVPAEIRKATSDYYDRPSAALNDALSGAAESWHAPTSGKLLDLWMATRVPLAWDLDLGLGEDALSPELGMDRARIVADALVARGLPRALAVLAGTSIEGPSKWFLPASYLAEPAIFAEALALDREIARELASAAIPKMGLEDSPTVKRYLRAFLESHSDALGTRALRDAAAVLPGAVDEIHLERAGLGAKPEEIFQIALSVEKYADGALRRCNERWLATVPVPEMARALGDLLERHADLVVTDAVWQRVLSLLEINPADPTGDGDEFGFLRGVIDALAVPVGATHARLVALIETNGSALGRLEKSLTKKAGKSKKPAALSKKPAKEKKAATVKKAAKKR